MTHSNMKTMRKPTTSTTFPGGTFKLADDLILARMGYGAMQLIEGMGSRLKGVLPKSA